MTPLVTCAITHALGELYLGRPSTLPGAFEAALPRLLPLAGTYLLGGRDPRGSDPAGGARPLPHARIYARHADHHAGGPGRCDGPRAQSSPHAREPAARLRAGHGGRAPGRRPELRSRAVFAVAPGFGVVGSALAQAVAFAYYSAVSVVFYFDVRARKEAFDLEHLARLVESG